jgi:hypothetical protein
VDRSNAVAAFIALVLLASLATMTVAMPPHEGASGLSDGCRRCHVNGTSSTEAGSSLAIEGVPHQYLPGHEYSVRVELERGAGPRPYYDVVHAFQLGVRGGTLAIVNGSFVAIDDAEVGSRGASEATSWTVVWTAPEAGDVHFYAAAVIGDGDGTEEGDVRLEATALSYGPIEEHQDTPGPMEGRLYLVVIAALATVLVIALFVLTHHRPPPRELD